MHTTMLISAIVLATIASRGYCQPNPPNNPQSNPDTVPIKGIEYLLFAGAFYGAYRLVRVTKSDSSTGKSP